MKNYIVSLCFVVGFFSGILCHYYKASSTSEVVLNEPVNPSAVVEEYILLRCYGEGWYRNPKGGWIRVVMMKPNRCCPRDEDCPKKFDYYSNPYYDNSPCIIPSDDIEYKPYVGETTDTTGTLKIYQKFKSGVPENEYLIPGVFGITNK